MSTHFKIVKSSQYGYWLALLLFGLLMAAGYAAAHFMESQGHWVSGMNNQIVWGLPHVFAIFLILGASGALNVASLGSVFGKSAYKPWARLSALLAISLLIGGLIVLVLDLGRPERLIVAMTHYNFKSIFAWNIFLYTGFIFVAILYLWTMFERGLNRHTQKSGLLALIWRFVLTSGTGSIFGFLVARQFFDAAIMVPIFIVLSLVLGTAIFILTSLAVSSWGRSPIGEEVVMRLGRLMGIFIAVELFLVAAFHLTNLYAAEHHGIERFILLDGGQYTGLFWIGQVVIGGVLPLGIVFLSKGGRNAKGVVFASCLAIIGAFSQLYVTIIGGQAYPLVLFPGMKVSSSFYDGIVAGYAPSFPELLLGLGGIGLSLLLLVVVMRVLPFLPDDRAVKAPT